MGRVPFDEQAWLAGPAASRATAGEAGFTTLERTGARPTAEVNGLWGGYTGPGHKTIIPAEAHAKVTFRLVADQRPEDSPRRCGPGWRRTSRTASRPTCTPLPAASRRAPATSTPRPWTPCCGPSPRPSTPSPAAVLHPRGRQRPGGRPGGGARCPAALPRRRPAHRPHPLAERARAAADALPRGGGGGAPVARAGRGALF